MTRRFDECKDPRSNMELSEELFLDPSAFHELSAEGRSVLLHTASSGLFAVDDLSSAVLQYAKRNSSLRVGEVLEAFAHVHSAKMVEDALEDLKALGVLRQTAALTSSSVLARIAEFPLNAIVLNVNTGCNLSCTYCYKEDLTSPSKGQKLDIEKAKRGIDLLFKQGAERESLSVVFFGGEPLSNISLIKDATLYAEKRAEEEGKKVDFSLTTNATLLNEHIADWLDEHRFGISISMDGPQAVHDAHRRTIGGEGTHKIVSRKARMLIGRYRSRPVGARVTLTAGFANVEAIHQHLKDELGFAEVGYAPVTSNPISTFNLVGDELREVFESMKRLGRRYVSEAIRGENIGFSNMHQLMSDLYAGRRKALPCGAGVGLLAVDYRGDLNLCHRFTGSDLPTFGNVETGIKGDDLSRFLEAAIDRNGRGCATCRIRNLCSGGCYHESYATSGDPHAPVYHYCDLLRDWIDFGIEAYLSILERNPAFLRKHVSTRRTEV